jgi:hypothetical protein
VEAGRVPADTVFLWSWWLTTAFWFAQVPSSPSGRGNSGHGGGAVGAAPHREEQLTLHEEAIAVWEKGVKVSEQALGKVSLELDVERAKTEATRHGYLQKLQANTTSMKHTLDLDKMLQEKKVLTEQKQDLKVWEAALVEALVHVLNSQDNHGLLSELVEL